MGDIFTLAGQNLLTPMILSFVLGLAAALARSELSVPEAAAKMMSLYLLFAIGFKGGVAVSAHGWDAQLLSAMAGGVALSFALPFVAFALLRGITGLSVVDAAAVAAHYGSISIVTFVTATSVLAAQGIASEGFMVAVAAAMEAPAIVSALWLVARSGGGVRMDARLWHEILLNGSIVLLVGSFLIGAITGEAGMARIEPMVVTAFQGVLCLFLLDMGLVAGRGLRGTRVSLGVVVFGLLMPLIGAAAGLGVALMVGLSPGGVALMMTLAASASYIAVPAAMRVALPEANPSVSLTLALGITFPFNLTVGIPAYVAVAQAIGG